MTGEGQEYTGSLKLPMAPTDIRDALLAELASAGTLVQRMDVEDWAGPSAAAGWSAGDVVAHLNLALSLYTRLIDLAVSGRTGGGILRTVGQLSKSVAPVASPVFNALNKAIPRALDRALSPEVIQGQFAAGSRTLRERLERIEPGDYMKPVYYMGGPWPLSFFLASILNELAIHGWDISSKQDPDAHLDAAARSVLPWFYWSGSSWMFHPGKDVNGTIAVSLDDPSAQLWWSVAAGTVETGSGTPPSSNVTIRGESGTFVLLLAGRLVADDALRTTSISTEGREDLARRFLGAWRIV